MSTFQKDVLEDIKGERANIQQQIDLMQPLIKEMHKSTSQKIISNSSYFLMEMVLWLLALAAIAWCIFVYLIPPFYNFTNVIFDAKQTGKYSQQTLDILEISLRGLIAIIAILCIIIARQLGKLRRKNNITSVAGKTIVSMQNKLEERLKVLDDFEKKYDYILNSEANIQLDQFTNPLDYPPAPPKGDTLL